VQFLHFYDEKPTFRISLKDLLKHFSINRPKKINGQRAEIGSEHILVEELFHKMEDEARKVVREVFPVDIEESIVDSENSGLFKQVNDNLSKNCTFSSFILILLITT